MSCVSIDIYHRTMSMIFMCLNAQKKHTNPLLDIPAVSNVLVTFCVAARTLVIRRFANVNPSVLDTVKVHEIKKITLHVCSPENKLRNVPRALNVESINVPLC